MMMRTIWMAGAAAIALLAGSTAPTAAAAASPIPPAFTYADLLDPVPDAGARIIADDAQQDRTARLIPAQYWAHHHHHHHHSWQWHRDNGYYWNGGGWGLIPGYHHHHHAAWWYRNRGYYWNGWAWAPRFNGHHHHHHHHWGW